MLFGFRALPSSIFILLTSLAAPLTAQEIEHEPTTAEVIEEREAIVSPDQELAPVEKAELSPIAEPPASTEDQLAVAAAGAANESAETLGVPASLAPDVVGAGGAFTQRIDIDIPEYRDLPLAVALTYISSDIARAGADKFVAFGWSLQGFSVIERKSLGGGVPTYDDGQDLYALDGEELMACAAAGATNPWVLKYPLRYLTDNPSASCSTGGNLTARVEDFRRITFDTVANTFTVTRSDGVRLIYTSVGTLVGDTRVRTRSRVIART